MDRSCHFFNRKVTDLLWLQTSFIGDTILTSAAINLAARLWPGIRQSLITTPAGAEILGPLPAIDRTFVFAKRKGNFFRSFRDTAKEIRTWCADMPADSFPVMLQAHKSARSSILTALTGLPVITYRQSSLWPLLLKEQKSLVDRIVPFHESARIAMLLEPLGASRDQILESMASLSYSAQHSTHHSTRHSTLPSTVDRDSSDFGFLTEGSVQRKSPLVAIAPGSVWGTKRWPVERFSELAVQLLRNYPTIRLVLIGSGAESTLCDQIQRVVFRYSENQSRLINLAGKTSLRELPEIFRMTNLVVCNDSSPVHFASAAGVPTVAIFGATVPAFGFGPMAPKSLVVDAGRISCRPCSDHGPQVCPLGHFRCMNDISIADVLAACATVIGDLRN